MYGRLGAIHANARNFESARECYAKARSLSPFKEYPRLCFNLAISAYKSEDYTDALTWTAKAASGIARSKQADEEIWSMLRATLCQLQALDANVESMLHERKLDELVRLVSMKTQVSR